MNNDEAPNSDFLDEDEEGEDEDEEGYDEEEDDDGDYDEEEDEEAIDDPEELPNEHDEMFYEFMKEEKLVPTFDDSSIPDTPSPAEQLHRNEEAPDSLIEIVPENVTIEFSDSDTEQMPDPTETDEPEDEADDIKADPTEVDPTECDDDQDDDEEDPEADEPQDSDVEQQPEGGESVSEEIHVPVEVSKQGQALPVTVSKPVKAESDRPAEQTSQKLPAGVLEPIPNISPDTGKVQDVLDESNLEASVDEKGSTSVSDDGSTEIISDGTTTTIVDGTTIVDYPGAEQDIIMPTTPQGMVDPSEEPTPTSHSIDATPSLTQVPNSVMDKPEDDQGHVEPSQAVPEHTQTDTGHQVTGTIIDNIQPAVANDTHSSLGPGEPDIEAQPPPVGTGHLPHKVNMADDPYRPGDFNSRKPLENIPQPPEIPDQQGVVPDQPSVPAEANGVESNTGTEDTTGNVVDENKNNILDEGSNVGNEDVTQSPPVGDTLDSDIIPAEGAVTPVPDDTDEAPPTHVEQHTEEAVTTTLSPIDKLDVPESEGDSHIGRKFTDGVEMETKEETVVSGGFMENLNEAVAVFDPFMLSLLDVVSTSNCKDNFHISLALLCLSVSIRYLWNLFTVADASKHWYPGPPRPVGVISNTLTSRTD